MASTPTKRVAIYGRVSTVGKGQDVGMQLDELRQVVGQRDWQVAGEYIDDGVSGTKDSRPALDRMMTDVRRGRVDVVLVWRFDRFARSTSHLLTALDEFRRRGVDFISTFGPLGCCLPKGSASGKSPPCWDCPGRR